MSVAETESTPEVTATESEVHTSPPSLAFLERIERDFARRHLLLSEGERGEVEHLAVAETTDPAAVHNTGVALGRTMCTRTCDAESLARRIDEAYAAQTDSRGTREDTAGEDDASELEADLDTLTRLADRDLLSTGGKGPVVRLVDAMLFEAVHRGASDLHVQPLADRTLVRLRVDGVLHDVRELSRKLTDAVSSRVKVMGHMDIAERRVPQDGRATVTVGAGPESRSIDLRISSLPTSYGERVVIRLLDRDRGLAVAELGKLGMEGELRDRFLGRVSRPNGIVLVTGPTGSGKTTTLYATLRHLAKHHAAGLNVMTVEDPIEYELSTLGLAISQSQINTRKGVTFATGLRHILRQDPDVVMVGEIRDAETARTAIQASLTGHLVLSTLHTNNSASAVTRLIDLGVEPYLVSASLSAVLAQRLVRRVHLACAGEGCDACIGTGLLGRTGLFELLIIDESMRDAIGRGAGLSELRARATRAGLRTLAQHGRERIARGETTELEVQRVAADLGSTEDELS